MEVIKRSTEGSIKAERENHAQRIDMMRHNAAQRRETVLASIQVLYPHTHTPIPPYPHTPKPSPSVSHGGYHHFN
jgi:hypothetical protein